VLFSVLLIITSIVLNLAIDSTSAIYGIGAKSGGGLFLSSTTTLPEMTAFVLFVRQGYVSAGIGSILGSQIFNFGQIVIGDMIYNKDVVIHNQSSQNL
jgi:Ca2+/Na+ antiporter